jgi:FkbM family methyltransferase
VGAPQEKLAQWLLRFGSPFMALRSWPLVGPCVKWASAKLVPRDALTWVQVQSGAAKGLWLHLNPRTGKTYFEGAGEESVQQTLERYLKAGMTFYDVGANIGVFSLIAARLVGEKGRVVAFEADPEIAGRLREHLARNQFTWATVEEKAVWSEAKTVYFARTNPETSPDRGLGHVVAAAGTETIEVRAVTLDKFAETERAPDLIKCDVEGAEVEVFRGGQNLLKEKRPAIVCELHSEENRRSLASMFQELGYACMNCGTNHVLALPQ